MDVDVLAAVLTAVLVTCPRYVICGSLLMKAEGWGDGLSTTPDVAYRFRQLHGVDSKMKCLEKCVKEEICAAMAFQNGICSMYNSTEGDTVAAIGQEVVNITGIDRRFCYYIDTQETPDPCYIVSNRAKSNRNKGISFCEGRSTRLPTPRNLEQNNFIHQLYDEQIGFTSGANQIIYLGAYRPDVATGFSWELTGQPLSSSWTDWAPDEPTNQEVVKCAAISRTGQWKNIPCNVQDYTVCQYP